MAQILPRQRQRRKMRKPCECNLFSNEAGETKRNQRCHPRGTQGNNERIQAYRFSDKLAFNRIRRDFVQFSSSLLLGFREPNERAWQFGVSGCERGTTRTGNREIGNTSEEIREIVSGR